MPSRRCSGEQFSTSSTVGNPAETRTEKLTKRWDVMGTEAAGRLVHYDHHAVLLAFEVRVQDSIQSSEEETNVEKAKLRGRARPVVDLEHRGLHVKARRNL